PDTKWVRGRRYVLDGKVVTSGGVTASLDASLFALEKLLGYDIAERTARSLGYAWHREQDPTGLAGDHVSRSLGALDFVELFLHGGFDWSRSRVGVLLYGGVSELSLAGSLDTFPRSLGVRTTTVGLTRKVFTSRGGMKLVPTESLGEAFGLDLFMVPSGAQG